jgi:tRNA threonylcarbamoyladenosine biosynthesis protein TsaE
MKIDNENRIFGLVGSMGAGKTFFVKKIAKELGCQEIVSSPTYNLLQVYTINYLGFDKILHFDLHRLEKLTAQDQAWFLEEISDPKALVFIEWPELIIELCSKIEIIKIPKYVAKI